MEQWSNLRNTLNYIEHGKLPQNFHNLGISTVNFYKNNSGIMEENVIEVDFGPTPNVLREEYLDIYKGIHSKIVNTTRFDENSDLSTTYLGRSDRSKSDKHKAGRAFPHIRTLVYIRKVVRQNRMSITFAYRCKQIIHVKIILHML